MKITPVFTAIAILASSIPIEAYTISAPDTFEYVIPSTSAPTPIPTTKPTPATKKSKWNRARKDGRCGKSYGWARCHPTESGKNLPWSLCCNTLNGWCGKTGKHCSGRHGVSFKDLIVSEPTAAPTAPTPSPARFKHAFDLDADGRVCAGRVLLLEDTGRQTCAKRCEVVEGCVRFSWGADNESGHAHMGPCFWERNGGAASADCAAPFGVNTGIFSVYKLVDTGSATPTEPAPAPEIIIEETLVYPDPCSYLTGRRALSCAPPQPGCSYKSSDEKNADGCPKFPCGVLECVDEPTAPPTTTLTPPTTPPTPAPTTATPTASPTTAAPTASPTASPTPAPATAAPTPVPTSAPTASTSAPTFSPTEAPTPATTQSPTAAHPDFQIAPDDARWTRARTDGRCGPNHGWSRCHRSESGVNLPWSMCCNLSTGRCGQKAQHCGGTHGVSFEALVAGTDSRPSRAPARIGFAFLIDETSASPVCAGRVRLRESAGRQTCAKWCEIEEGCTHFSWRPAEHAGDGGADKKAKGPCFWEKEAGPACVPAEGVDPEEGWTMYYLNNVGSATTISAAVAAGAVTLDVASADIFVAGNVVRVDGAEERTVVDVAVAVAVAGAPDRLRSRRRRLAAGRITLSAPLESAHAAGATVEVVAAAGEGPEEEELSAAEIDEGEDGAADEDEGTTETVEEGGEDDDAAKAFVRKHYVALIAGTGGVAGLAAILVWAARSNASRNKTTPAKSLQLPEHVVVATAGKQWGRTGASFARLVGGVDGPHQQPHDCQPQELPPSDIIDECTRGSLERLKQQQTATIPVCDDLVREIKEEEAASFRDLEIV